MALGVAHAVLAAAVGHVGWLVVDRGAGVDLAVHRSVAVVADRSGGQTQDVDEVGVPRRDIAVHEQRDPPGQCGLIGRQAREQIEQGLVSGAVAVQEPVLDSPDPFPRPGEVGQPGVEVGEVPAGQLSQVVCIRVDVGHGGAQLTEQPDSVEPVEGAAVVPASGNVADAPTLVGGGAGHTCQVRTSRHVRSKGSPTGHPQGHLSVQRWERPLAMGTRSLQPDPARGAVVSPMISCKMYRKAVLEREDLSTSLVEGG